MSYDNLFWGGKTEGATQVDNHSQWRIATESLLADRDIFHPTEFKKFPLGAVSESRDGRRWRYQQAGESLTKCLINQSAVVQTNWELIAKVPAVAVGAKSFTINSTLSTALVAGDLIDGILTVEDQDGEGNAYLIKDHTIGTKPTIWIADAGGIRTAWVSATTEVTLTPSKYKDVIVFPTDPTGLATGINHTSVSDGYFFWGQTRGPCPVVNSADTIIVGDMCGCATATAGQASLLDVAVEGDVLLGYVMQAASAAGETALIDLRLE